jgi:hypothetical protein
VLTALAFVAFAQASDVGTVKKLGLGVATGPFFASVTGKYYLSDKVGISAYLGTNGFYHGIRANFEMEFVEFHEWDFGRLDMYWDAGVDAGLYTSVFYTSLGYGGELGVGGGVGVELQFSNVPASVFVDAGLGIHPICGSLSLSGFCLVQGRGAAGGRWYF